MIIGDCDDLDTVVVDEADHFRRRVEHALYDNIVGQLNTGDVILFHG